jgi:hypothetical protein
MNSSSLSSCAVGAPRRQPRAALVVGISDVNRAVVVSVAGEAGTDNLQALESSPWRACWPAACRWPCSTARP